MNSKEIKILINLNKKLFIYGDSYVKNIIPNFIDNPKILNFPSTVGFTQMVAYHQKLLATLLKKLVIVLNYLKNIWIILIKDQMKMIFNDCDELYSLFLKNFLEITNYSQIERKS